jgi:gluconate 2-dehydrogenase gamma chain
VLAALNQQAVRNHGGAFHTLAFETRNGVLRCFETGAHRAQFNLVLEHVMQGYYGSPRHGGNEEFASWRMLGVPPVPVRGRLHYTIAPEGVNS